MIIEGLKQIQKRDSLTDIQVAKKLGIHPISWNRIKNGRAKFGKKFIQAVLKAYPELALKVIEYLTKD
jgi:transcriptional regulator with XRE-family HTH domain